MAAARPWWRADRLGSIWIGGAVLWLVGGTSEIMKTIIAREITGLRT